MPPAGFEPTIPASEQPQNEALDRAPTGIVKPNIDVIKLSKPSGFSTYHQVKHSEILHGARFALSVLYGSQNRQRPLLYTSLTDWFL